MVVVMKERATKVQIDAVISRLIELGMDVHRSSGVTRTVLGVVGAHKVDPELIGILDGVHEVLRITEPYKLVSRTFKPDDTVIAVGRRADRRRRGDRHGRAVLGRDREQVDAIAAAVKARAPRSCAAARSSRARRRTPSRASGEEGLQMLRRAADAPAWLISEVMDISQVELVGGTPTSCRSARATCRTSRCSARSGTGASPCCSSAGWRRRSRSGCCPPSTSWRRQRRRHPVRARHPHVRDGHAQHARHLRDSRREEAEPPADHRRPEPRHRPPGHGRADGARRGRRRRRRPDHRGPQRSRSRPQRRRAVDVPAAIRFR